MQIRFITVNGHPVIFHGKTISYEQALKCDRVLRLDDYTVAVRYKGAKHPARTLRPGETARCEHGMVISIIRTDNA
jgi:hypothetical protein